MKYAILVGDGMGDYPLPELDNRTPLEAANTPNMDSLARYGITGLVHTIPDDMAPASDVANMSLLGYSPEEHYTGRGPLEAANLGIDLAEGDVAFRCNLVTVEEDTIVDYSAGHITTEEAREVVGCLARELGTGEISFHPGTSYRHIVVLRNAPKELAQIECFPPHDIVGESVSQHLPN
jgi:2,3-bisphosphoglycerate-independent phosphoglycerate mutase